MYRGPYKVVRGKFYAQQIWIEFCRVQISGSTPHTLFLKQNFIFRFIDRISYILIAHVNIWLRFKGFKQ